MRGKLNWRRYDSGEPTHFAHHGSHRLVGSRRSNVALPFDPLGAVKAVGSAIGDALDPVKAPGKVKRFTAEEIAELNAARKLNR